MLIQQRFSLMKQRNTEVILKLLSNAVGDSYDQIIFPHKLLIKIGLPLIGNVLKTLHKIILISSG